MKLVGGGASFANAAIDPDENIRAAGSSIASFTSLQKIEQLQSRILPPRGMPVSRTSPHRKFAGPNAPELNAEHKEASDFAT